MASLEWPGEILLVAGVATLAFILISFWFSGLMAKRGWSWQVRSKPRR